MSVVHLRNLGLIGIFVLCSALLFFSPTDNWRWDPSFYYAQLRSPIIDGDVDMRKEAIPGDQMARQPATGLIGSIWPLGVSISWSPFFLAAHGYTLVTRGSQAADGLNPVYIAAVSAGSALYGLIGVLITYRTCRLFARRGLSMLTAGLVLMATPLFFYVYRQPLMGHSVGLLVTALLLYVVIQLQRERIPFQYSGILTGTLVGLSVATRWLGVTAVVLPAILFLIYVVTALRQRDWPRVRALVWQILIATLAAVLMMMPQMVLWHRLYNTWFRFPVTGQLFTTRATLFPPYLPHLFVHTNRGLLYWTPFLLFGMIGIFRVRPISLRWMLLAYLAAYCYVLGSFVTWHGGGGYGARYFNEASPILAVGFVCLFRELWSLSWGRFALASLSVALIAHQLLLVTIVEQGWVSGTAYINAQPLGWQFQVDGLVRLVKHPSDFFLPRVGVSAPHQAPIVNILAGARDWTTYRIPLIAGPIIGLGLAGYSYFGRLRLLPMMALLVVVYMVGWFWFLLLAT